MHKEFVQAEEKVNPAVGAKADDKLIPAAEIPIVVKQNSKPFELIDHIDEEEKKEFKGPQKVQIFVNLFESGAIVPSGLKQSMFDGFKSIFQDKSQTIKAALEPGSDAETYTEAIKKKNQMTEVSIQWKLKNSGDVQWPEGVKLRLIKCYPQIDFTAKSNIAQLKPKENGTLLLSINIPPNYYHHFMVLHFKMQIGKRLFEPNLLVNLKLINRPDSNEDLSSFPDEQRLKEQS